jgi:hypothetical protein
MDVQVNKRNGETFTFEQFDIMVKDFIVSSIPLESVYSNPEGSDKRIDHGTNYGTRTIRVPFALRSRDLMDYPLLRDLLFNLVLEKESFYIREMRRAKKLAYAFVDPNEPARMDPTTDNKFVGGKRYLVRLQNTFDIEQIELDGEGELVFETTELPFAESIGTTQDIHENGVSSDDKLWGFGMGLIADDDSHIYTHTGTSFKIYNAGNVPIHPFEQELKITIKNLNGSDFLLRNTTNNSAFGINTEVSSSQEIVLDGPNITSNGLQFLRNTNKQFIELSPGWNEFELSHNATVSFDFPFYYL